MYAHLLISVLRWSPKYESELYLYGESNGIIWDVVVNRTSQPYNKLFVVGAFDTVSETSQIQFCSVGEWDGLSFDKVRMRMRENSHKSDSYLFHHCKVVFSLYSCGTCSSMIYYSVLHSIVLHCSVLCCTVLYCTCYQCSYDHSSLFPVCRLRQTLHDQYDSYIPLIVLM